MLTVSSADGEFVLAENGIQPRWFPARGTGLSPLLTMPRKTAEFAAMTAAGVPKDRIHAERFGV